MQAIEWQERSTFYRWRCLTSVFLISWSLFAQPFIWIFGYIYLFLYPLVLFAFGQPLQNASIYSGFFLCFAYTIYWAWDFKRPFTGGTYNLWFRQARVFKWAAEYFPMRLVPSLELRKWAGASNDADSRVDLPKDVNYLVGYHPHGPLAVGATSSFGNDSLGFSRIFPGIKPYMSTINALHYIPIHRDYVKLGGRFISENVALFSVNHFSSNKCLKRD